MHHFGRAKRKMHKKMHPKNENSRSVLHRIYNPKTTPFGRIHERGIRRKGGAGAAGGSEQY